MSAAMLHESIWTDRPKYEQAEAHYQRFLAGTVSAHGGKKVRFQFTLLFFISLYVHVSDKSIKEKSLLISQLNFLYCSDPFNKTIKM